jgi:hypothetical protein
MTNDALGPVRHAPAPLPRPNGGPVQLDTQVSLSRSAGPKPRPGHIHAIGEPPHRGSPAAVRHERQLRAFVWVVVCRCRQQFRLASGTARALTEVIQN